MADKRAPNAGGSDLLLYRAEDGKTRIQVRLEGGTVWLTQGLMADLFQTTTQNITTHIRHIYAEREMNPAATCKEDLQVRQEGGRSVQRRIKLYSLEMILAVGYRVRSFRGVQFRQWATERLREYVVKGFTLDDERLKQAGGGNYFDELLARTRDIRSSEKIFWRKVLDIYALSADYDPNTDLSQKFFAVVQNKMHWAAHGHTAAEIVAARADASQPNMGLTSWTGSKPSRTDAEIAKNYLMIDGEGDPNTSKSYAEAIEALFAVAYTVKFSVKKSQEIDYGVMPLESLWWADDMSAFSTGDKAKWQWTAMIMQPSFVTAKIVADAVADVKKKNPPATGKLRFESLTEGTCAQTLHIGPFAEEGPTIARVHEFIRARGGKLVGKHHEIYLSDVRKADPAKWKTVVRQPLAG